MNQPLPPMVYERTKEKNQVAENRRVILSILDCYEDRGDIKRRELESLIGDWNGW